MTLIGVPGSPLDLGGVPIRRLLPRRQHRLVGAAELAATAERLVVPLDPAFEHALVPLDGECQAEGEPLAIDTLYYLGPGRREVELGGGTSSTRVLLLGGVPFGEPVLMWWNFVARTSDEIVAARDDWEGGRRFGAVRAYAGERLPAPRLGARPGPPS